MKQQTKNNSTIKKSNEDIKALKVIFYPILWILFVTLIFWKLFKIPFFKDEPKEVIQIQTWNTNEVPIIWTNDISKLTWYIESWDNDVFSWVNLDINVKISDIDKVLSILENGEKWVDFSIITPQPQYIKYSSNVDSDFKNYLVNNIYSLTIPNDIKWWYLYIKLHKPLKYMSSIWVYQPITIKTNIYVNWWWVYGRLNTKNTLPIYEENKEFLYDLTKIPIRTAKHNQTNWISTMKWKLLKIWGFVSDTSWNYIENIIFIWER